jgi:topoisomerase-4 subunit B
LKDLLEEELESEILYPIVHLKDEDIEVAITHSDKSQTETYFSLTDRIQHREERILMLS